MKPTSGHSPVTLPPALLAERQAEAAEEQRPALDVLQDAVHGYVRDARARREIQQASLSDGALSPKRTPGEAAARMRERRKGTVLPAGMTIRDLIDHERA